MKCTDISSARPEGSLCSYSGYLSVPALTPQVAEQVDAAAKAAGLDVEIGNCSIEVEYKGRDSNQFVVEFLKKLAAAIGTASGEIRCEIGTDEADPCFEFFTIRDSKLVRQRGSIVRQPGEETA